MSSTKQDYEAIAAAIRDQVDTAKLARGESDELSAINSRHETAEAKQAAQGALSAVRNIADRIADHFAKNPKFNRAEFLRNCGVQS